MLQKALVCFIFFKAFTLLGQNKAFQTITTENGLSQGMIFSMLEDKQGFLWFATKEGLNRYDGRNFKIFHHESNNPKSISGNVCTALFEDRFGRIWIGTEQQGINVFDPITQQFYSCKFDQGSGLNTKIHSITLLKETLDGDLLMFTNDPNKIYLIHVHDALPSATNPLVNWLKPVDASKYDVPANLKKDQFAIPIKNYINFKPNDSLFIRQNSSNKDYSYEFIEEDKNTYWLIGLKHLRCFNKGRLIKEILLTNQTLGSINRLKNGKYAIVSHKFLWVFSHEELLGLQDLTANNEYEELPSENGNINFVWIDNSGNTWYSTRGYGLLKNNTAISKLFKSYLPKRSVGELYEDKHENIFVHANYFPSYHYYTLNPKTDNIDPIPPKIKDEDFKHDAIAQDNTGNYWLIGVYTPINQRLLRKYDKSWNLQREFKLHESPDEQSIHIEFKEDQQGNFWIGYINGILVQLNPVTEELKQFNYSHLIKDKGTITQTNDIYIESAESIWLATDKGVVHVINIKSDPKFELFSSNNSMSSGITFENISGITKDPIHPNILWFSTKGNGLERYDQKTNSFIHFGLEHGLPNKHIYGIVTDAYNKIWFSSNRGLTCLNPVTYSFTNYNNRDGLQNDEFNSHSYLKAQDGDLYFGGINGINRVTPENAKKAGNKPIIKIVDISINNNIQKPQLEGSVLNIAIEYTNTINLGYQENVVEFNLALLDYANPEKHRYQYQLEGLNNNWVESGNNNKIVFAHMPRGKHIFKTRGTANGEIWSDPLELTIYVDPPIFLSWWAILLYIIFVAIVIWRFYQNQVNRIRLQEQVVYQEKETQKLADIDSIKTKFFSNISHEIRTPLSLIIAPIKDLMQSNPANEAYQVIHRNAERLHDLINQILDINKLEERKMDLEFVEGNLVQFIHEICQSFKPFAKNKEIDIVFHNTNGQIFGVYDKDKYNKIISNLLSNAVKFSKIKSEIKVNISTDTLHENINVTIQDTGIGIPVQNINKIFDRFYQADNNDIIRYQGTGIGLSLVKELVKLLRGKITVESEEFVGTTFSVTLPISKEFWAGYTIHNELLYDYQSHTINDDQNEIANNEFENIILIIDDNEDLRTYLSQLFEHEYRVLEAENGVVGFEKAVLHIPDVIISDVMMPEMDGIEFCKHIKSDPRTNHIPVVLLTAKTNMESKMDALESGADDYIHKPFVSQEIRYKIKNLLQLRERIRTKFNTKKFIVDIEDMELSSKNTAFLNKLQKILEENYTESTFSVDKLAHQMQLSSVQLRRKLKAITNCTLVECLRDFRILKAMQLLKSDAVSISEIAYQCGFESPAYFSRVFQEHEGMSPSEFRSASQVKA